MKAFVFPGQGAQFVGMGKLFPAESLPLPSLGNVYRLQH